MKIIRFILAVPFWLAALFCLFAALMPTDTDLTRKSFANQQAMHADMEKIGDFTEEHRIKNGSPPTTKQLLNWMASQEFEYRWFDEYKNDPRPNRLSIGITAKNEEFIVGETSSLSKNGKHTYRISYWNKWTEEYAPETGAHTFATSLDDYGIPVWQRLLILLLASVLASLGYIIGIRRAKPKGHYS